MVSLRGDRLKLLSLRGRVVVAGHKVDSVELESGLEIHLSPTSTITVTDVVLPDHSVVLSASGLPATAIPSSVGIIAQPTPSLTHASNQAAQARLWLHGDRWNLEVGTARQTLQIGDTFVVGGTRFHLARRALRGTAETADRSTVRPRGLQIIVRYESVHLFRNHAAPLLVDGIGARMISELSAFGVPVSWTMLAEAIWGTGVERPVLRKRLDGVLARLRRQLRKAEIRDDLVRSTGLGQIELFLLPGDTVVDQL